jgi:hypothetical protein
MAVGLLVAYAAQIGDPDSYRGEFNPVQRRWEPAWDETAFVSLTVFIACGVPMGVFGLAAWVIYFGGISEGGLASPAEPDPIGEIVRTGGAFPTR